jgi:hypothetical protein
MTSEVGSSYDARAVLPLGIPLGRQEDGRFAVRMGRCVFTLEALEEALWLDAHGGFEASTLAARRGAPMAPTVLRTLTDAGILYSMTSETALDWCRLRALRPLPRAIPLGYDREARCFTLRVGDSGVQLRLDRIAYALWMGWNGLATLESSVATVIQAFGLSPLRIRERAVRLACLGVFAAACYLDAGNDNK